jgi:hypothetical protein
MSLSSTESSTKPLHLLVSFNRGYIARGEGGKEVVRTEWVKCRIWTDDIDAFLAIHAPIKAPYPTPDKETKWMEYMTVTKDQMTK